MFIVSYLDYTGEKQTKKQVAASNKRMKRDVSAAIASNVHKKFQKRKNKQMEA